MNLRRAWGVAALLAALTPAQAQSQQSAPLTLDECIRRALAVPSTVSLARADREIAALGITQARAGFLPHASANLGYTYNNASRASAPAQSYVALNGVREYIGLANILQEIDTSGRLRAEYARARASRDAATASLAVAERDLKRAVAAAYYRVLLARHLAEALETSLAESAAFERRTRLLASQGEAAQADVVKAAALALSLEQAVTTAQLAADLANQDLASFWTTDSAPRLDLIDVFTLPPPTPEPAALETTAFLRRPEFRLLDAEFQIARADVKVARAALLPRLTTNFQYGLDENRVEWSRRGYAAFASLNITLFDWFASASAIKQARTRVTQNTETRAITERTLSRDYQSALARVRRVYALIDPARRQIDFSQQDLNLSRVRYEGGEGPSLDVVVAQQQLVAARSGYYIALSDYLLARWDLEVTSGR